MPLVPMKEILDRAFNNHYAVGAFNVVNLEMMEAIIQTAEKHNSPVILNIAQVHFPYIQLEHIFPAIQAMATRAAIPIALNLDHGQDKNAVIRVIRQGFTSVMFDGSRLGWQENIDRTAEVAAICHAVDVSVEAELGAVGGDEGGALESQADAALFTNPEQAGEFVQRTGIDALAIAIGNSHGTYKGEPKLDFDRLQAIRQVAGIPLVLHGGSGISNADFRTAISMGIAKINIYTSMSLAALEAAKTFLNKDGQYHAFPELMQTIKSAIADVVEQSIDIFGSAGQANRS